MNQNHIETRAKKGSRKFQPDNNGAPSTNGTLGNRARKRLRVVVTYLALLLVLSYALVKLFQ